MILSTCSFDFYFISLSDSLDPLPVSDKFPDSVTLIAKGVSVRVSASVSSNHHMILLKFVIQILSLHSPVLRELLYKNGKPINEASIDVDIESFGSFIRATMGDFPSGTRILEKIYYWNRIAEKIICKRF